MNYEKPCCFVLGSAAIAIHDFGHRDSHSGNAGKHSLLYESCTGHGQEGWEMIACTSSTGSAYEADE